MEGKTIKLVEKGKLADDEALLLYMTDGSIYVIEAGSSYSQGILCINKVDSPPLGFIKEE